MKKDRNLLIWSVIALISILLLGLSGIFSLIISDNEAELSTKDSSWTGSSDMKDAIEKEGFDVYSLRSSPALLYEENDPEGTIFITLGPGRVYSLTEQHAINKFISRGGKMILADDSENQLSKRFDIDIVDGQLYDQNFVSNPDLVKFNVGTEFFDGFILMNKPASLTFSSGQALIASTTSAWVDRNGNGINDNVTTNQGEAQGIRYLCAITDPDFLDQEKGTAVVISDPSMFMNGMIEMENNLEFALAMIDYLLPEGGKVIFDDSVHMTSGADGIYQRGLMGIARVTTDVNIKIVLGSLAVLAMLAVGYIYESPGKPRHEVILDRTGVAELIEPELLEDDLDELKKAVLERIRTQSGLSVEDMADLSWDELREAIGNEQMYRFVRTGKFKGGIEKLLLEVMEWERK